MSLSDFSDVERIDDLSEEQLQRMLRTLAKMLRKRLPENTRFLMAVGNETAILAAYHNYGGEFNIKPADVFRTIAKEADKEDVERN